MDVLVFAILGLGSGAIYGLLAQGIVAIYRSSGVLNLAQGAIAMASAYLFVSLHSHHDVPTLVAIVLVVIATGALGSLIQLAVMGLMRGGSTMTRMCVTLGLFITLESTISLIYGTEGRLVDSYLPNNPISLWGGTAIGADRLILLGIGIVVTAGLWCLYKFTQFGRLTTGVWQNPDAVSALGGSPRAVAAWNWTLGSGLAGLCGCLIAPFSGLQIDTLSMLVVPALAAAIAGRFSSFPGAFLTGLALGAVESVVSKYTSTSGLSEAVPFLAIVILLVIRGRGLPVRGELGERLPSVGSGRFGRTGILVVCAVLFAAAFLGPTSWAGPITITALMILMSFSIVFVTGLTGQFNLAPYAFGGIAAMIGAHLAHSWGWTLVPCVLAGAVVAIPIGLVVGLPAIRARGANLAVITLALGTVVEKVIFDNADVNGGIAGITTGIPSVLGLKVDTTLIPARYAAVVLVVAALVGLLVVHIRRGPSGRRLLAVRDNERAAASVGISVSSAKLYAFSVAAMIAGVYGVLATQSTGIATFGSFSAFGSLMIVGTVVLAGIGSVGGGSTAGIIAAGGIVYTWASFIGLDKYLPLVSGLALVFTLVLQPSGMIPGVIEAAAPIMERLRLIPRPRQSNPDEVTPKATRVTPMELRVQHLSVQFGTVRAVDDLSLTVRPGEVLGLIGPNGAGKTAAMDAITGFVPSRGSVELGGVRVGGKAPHIRAAKGLGRSFQGIELFDDLTIGENVMVGDEGGGVGAHLRDLFRPSHSRLSPTARAAIALFQLEPHLAAKPQDVSFGVRRLAGIARAVASAPSVLLLDEPAAGLDAREVDELRRLLRWLAEEWGMAIILVEHHVDMVIATCDRVQVMVLGRTLTEGTGDEIESDERVRAAYLGGTPTAERERA